MFGSENVLESRAQLPAEKGEEALLNSVRRSPTWTQQGCGGAFLQPASLFLPHNGCAHQLRVQRGWHLYLHRINRDFQT